MRRTPAAPEGNTVHSKTSDDNGRTWRLVPESRWRGVWRVLLTLARCLFVAASALTVAIMLVLAGVWMSASEEEGLLRVFDFLYQWAVTDAAGNGALIGGASVG